MTEQPNAAHWTLLERLDIALAARLSASTLVEFVQSEQFARIGVDAHDRSRFVAGALHLRGIRVSAEDAHDVYSGNPGRFRPDHQEHKLLTGAHMALDAMLDRSRAGRPPDGWHLVELFKKLTDGVARFRNNSLRRDRPWDALRGVGYPEPDAIEGRIDQFLAAESYGESERKFEQLHPVRRAVRVFWRFARIAPFPDFNLTIAFYGLNAYLVAHGYPLLLAEQSDRDILTRALRSRRPPRRIVSFESRLLAAAEQPAGLARPERGTR